MPSARLKFWVSAISLLLETGCPSPNLLPISRCQANLLKLEVLKLEALRSALKLKAFKFNLLKLNISSVVSLINFIVYFLKVVAVKRP